MTQRIGGWLVLALVGVACEDDGIERVGPPRDFVTTNPYTVGGGDGVQGALSCDLRGIDGRCLDYFGAGWEEATARSDCEQDNGQFVVDEVCPVANRLGTCRLNANESNQINIRYYLGTFAEADAEERARLCKLDGGQWISDL